VDAHLAECAACAAELRALRRTVDLLRSLPPSPAPSRDLARSVAARVRGGEGRTPLALRLAERIGWFPPLAAAVSLGALAWLVVPLAAPVPPTGSIVPTGPTVGVIEEPPPIRELPASAPRGGGRALAAGAPAAPDLRAWRPRASSLPSIAACLERSRAGGPAPDDCARWYSWYLAKALSDARDFVDEVERLPKAARDPWIERVSELAARSGSAPLVGAQLRRSRDPAASVLAARFERGGVALGPAGYAGR
jgi:hypothetical protein